jgi:hypothetical protein
VRPRDIAVISEFSGHPREPEWHRAYIDAKTLVEETRGVEVVDVAELAPNQIEIGDPYLAVLLHVIRAADAERPTTRARLRRSGARQNQDDRLALGVAALGEGADEAAERIYVLLGDAPGALPRWIQGIDGLDALRQQIAEWLLLVLDLARIRDSSRTDSESVLSEELPITEEGAVSRSRTFRSMP